MTYICVLIGEIKAPTVSGAAVRFLFSILKDCRIAVSTKPIRLGFKAKTQGDGKQGKYDDAHVSSPA